MYFFFFKSIPLFLSKYNWDSLLKLRLMILFSTQIKSFLTRYKSFVFDKNKKKLKKILKRKNFFFKKKYNLKMLVSRRLLLIMRRDKKTNLFPKKKLWKNYFFLKKFFLKMLMGSRKLLKTIFSFNQKMRQKRLTKVLFKRSQDLSHNRTMEYSLYNVLLRGHFFFFLKDAATYINLGNVYLNGRSYNRHTICMNKSDVLQLRINILYFRYFSFCKKFFRKKVKLMRLNAYRFFKKKYYATRDKFRLKKRKYPKYYFYFFIFKMNVPRYLEVDYTIMSIIVLRKLDISLQTTFFLNKMYTNKFFNLYNFKKIN